MVANCLIFLGLAYDALSNPQKAIQYFEKGLTIAKEIGDRRWEARCYDSLGNEFFLLSNLQKAIE